MAAQGMHALIGIEVRANGVVDFDRGDRGRAETLAGGGRRLFVIGRSGSDSGGISQRGTFLRGSLDGVRRWVPVPPSKMHRPDNRSRAGRPASGDVRTLRTERSLRTRRKWCVRAPNDSGYGAGVPYPGQYVPGWSASRHPRTVPQRSSVRGSACPAPTERADFRGVGIASAIGCHSPTGSDRSRRRPAPRVRHVPLRADGDPGRRSDARAEPNGVSGPRGDPGSHARTDCRADT